MKEKLKILFKQNKLLFIMCIVSFIMGIMFLVTSRGDSPQIILIFLVIGFSPLIIFLIIMFLTNHFYHKVKIRKILNTITIILSLVALWYYLCAIFLCAAIEAMNPITDVNSYRSVVSNSKLLKVFPKEIPKDVEQTEFYYAPGFLQGGTNYSLYYIDKGITLEEFDSKYREKAIWVGRKKDYKEKMGLLAGEFAYTPAYLKNEDDFIIYVIEGDCDKSGYCNHGFLLSTAFNPKTNEIIYRAEDW